MAHKKIFIVAGEPSGDLHASNLVRDMKTLNPDIEFYGIAGELSRSAGVDIIFDISKLALVGVVEVIKHISVVKKAHDAVMKAIESNRPDLVILVDYPGFNLKIAREISKKGIPIAYYISPQIWAWGLQRVHTIKKYIKKMVVFFKFEEDLYKSYGIDADFIGHPLIDVVKVSRSKDETYKKYNLSPEKKTIAILPGSRISEITKLLPIIAKGADIITKRDPATQFIISKHPDRPIELYETALKGTSFDYRFAEGDFHNIVAASDFAIAVSGTATLETTIIGTPYLIVYRVNLLTFLIYEIVADMKFLGLANVIAGRKIVPELLQYNMTAGNIAKDTLEIIRNPEKLSRIRQDLAKVTSTLGEGGASMRSAKAILKLL